jgi:hypothetical protein
MIKVALTDPDTEVQVARPTPQCDRLREVQEKSQAIHEFILEFLIAKGIEFGHFRGRSFVPISRSVGDLVAEFFEIDLNELENEKRRMIRDMRLSQAKREIDEELPLSKRKR